MTGFAWIARFQCRLAHRTFAKQACDRPENDDCEKTPAHTLYSPHGALERQIFVDFKSGLPALVAQCAHVGHRIGAGGIGTG